MFGYLEFHIMGFPLGAVLFFWAFPLWVAVMAGLLAERFFPRAMAGLGWAVGCGVGVPAVGVMHGLFILVPLVILPLGRLPFPGYSLALILVIHFGVPAASAVLAVYLYLRISRRMYGS